MNMYLSRLNVFITCIFDLNEYHFKPINHDMNIYPNVEMKSLCNPS